MAASDAAFRKKLDALKEPFPVELVYQREGPGGKKLDYVSIETVLGRLLDVAPEYRWEGRIVSIEDGRAVVEGTLTIGESAGFGVGSHKNPDLDMALKTANSEAIKNAAKNGFGIALELWNEGHRKEIAKQRKLSGASPAALKQEVYKLARVKLGKDKPTLKEVAEAFGVDVQLIADGDIETAKKILEENA